MFREETVFKSTSWILERSGIRFSPITLIAGLFLRFRVRYTQLEGLSGLASYCTGDCDCNFCPLYHFTPHRDNTTFSYMFDDPQCLHVACVPHPVWSTVVAAWCWVPKYPFQHSGLLGTQSPVLRCVIQSAKLPQSISEAVLVSVASRRQRADGDTVERGGC